MSRTIRVLAFIILFTLCVISQLRFKAFAGDIYDIKKQIPTWIELAGIDLYECSTPFPTSLPCPGGFNAVTSFTNDHNLSLIRTPELIQSASKPARRAAQLTQCNAVATKLPSAPGYGLIPFLFFVLPFAQIKLNRREAVKYGVLLLVMFLSVFFPYIVHSTFLF